MASHQRPDSTTPGDVFFTDYYNHRRRWGSSSFKDGVGTTACIPKPSGLVIDASNNLYLTDDSCRIRRITSLAFKVTTLWGDGNCNIIGYWTALALDINGDLLISDNSQTP
jgi:hypothetical protein